MKGKLKRDYYTDQKYYFTALRYIVEIIKAPKPSCVKEYKLFKTAREYEINSTYHLYRDGELLRIIPFYIKIKIKSKDRNDIKIQVPKNFYYYGVEIRKLLREYYLNV